MELRLTLQTEVSRSLAGLRQQTDQLGILQQQAATGNRIIDPSDDPLGTLAVLTSKAQDQRTDSYLGSIRDANQALNGSVSALRDAGDVLAEARQIAIEGSNAGNDATAFGALAQQVNALLNRLADLANSKDGNHYLFGGTATQAAPFVVTNNAGAPETVAYKGAADRATLTVTEQDSVTTYYAGSEVFQQRQRGTTAYGGTTGAAAGTGTDSATGQGSLLVSHTATTYAAGSGIQAGTGSAAGDTVLGPAGAHQLTVVDTSGTGAGGTVALNGGPAVAFTNTDTNLKVTGPAGEVVYVNTSAVTAGFNGNVALTANGTLSVDGGAKTAPINFSNNQVVTNGTTQAVTNVNSTNIRSTGTAHLEYTGTADAFQTLAALRDDLLNTRGLSAPQQLTAISQRLGDLDRVQNGVLRTVGEQSATLEDLSGLQNHLQNVQLAARQLTSDIQGADLSQVVVGLQSQQNLLQLTLSATSRIFNQSLLSFIH